MNGNTSCLSLLVPFWMAPLAHVVPWGKQWPFCASAGWEAAAGWLSDSCRCSVSELVRVKALDEFSS